jgi:hypothetical protein
VHTANRQGEAMQPHYNKQVTRFLPENGAICAETCRRDLINNIHIFKYICEFSWYITSIIDIKQDKGHPRTVHEGPEGG